MIVVITEIISGLIISGCIFFIGFCIGLKIGYDHRVEEELLKAESE